MIPFEIPDRFLADLAMGVVRRVGATLRDCASGRIVAHLQETGLLQRLVGNGSPLGLLLSAGQVASSVGANFQLAKNTTMLSSLGVQLAKATSMLSTLEMLGGATLAASAAGVGVSAAGFALVLQRLGNVERAVAGVHRSVLDARLAAERVDVRQAAEARGRAEALLHQAEEAWARSDAQAVWSRLEGPLDEAQRYWRGLVGGRSGPSAFLDPRFTLEEAAAAYEAALALAAARVRTLVLIDQFAAALHYAEDVLRWHDGATGGLVSIDVAAARSRSLADAEGIPEEDARGRLLRRAKRLLKAVREVHLHLADRPAMVRALMDRGVRGRDYVEALRDEPDSPVLMLPAS